MNIALLSSAFAAAILNAASYITTECDDGHLIKYPQKCLVNTSGVTTVDRKFIVGNSTNVSLRLDGKAALTMASAADAMLQRLLYGETANVNIQMTNRYADVDLTPFDSLYVGDTDIFSKEFRDFSGRYRHDRRYDYVPATVMSGLDPVGYGKFGGINSDFDNDDGNEGIFYWSSSSMSGDDLNAGTWKESFAEMLGGASVIKSMWMNFSDINWSNGFNSAQASCDLVNLGDGPYEHESFLGLRRGIAHMWWSSTRGQTDRRIIVDSLSGTNRVSFAEDFFDGLFGSSSLSKYKVEKIAYHPYDRISGRKHGLANQIISAMDRTYAGWSVGQRPLYWKEKTEVSGELYMTNTSKFGSVSLTYGQDDLYHVIVQDLSKPSSGSVLISTNSWEGYSNSFVSDTLEFDPHHDAGARIVGATGSISIDFNPWSNVWSESDLTLDEDFDVLDDDGIVVGTWSFDGETESDFVYVSSMSYCTTVKTTHVIAYGSFSSETNSHGAKYPIASAFSNGVVSCVTQYPIASMAWATGNDYNYVFKYDIGIGRYDPADRMSYRFRMFPLSTGNDLETLNQAAFVSAADLVSAVRTTCERESGGSVNASSNMSKERLGAAIVQMLPDNLSFKLVNLPVLSHDFGWRKVTVVSGEPTFYDKDGFEIQVPHGDDGWKVGHISVEKNLGTYVENRNPFVNTGVIAEMMYPRKTDFNFKAIKLNKDNAQ